MAVLHAGIATFLSAPHIPPDRAALEEAGATAAVLGLPYDSTTITRPGASHGPRRCAFISPISGAIAGRCRWPIRRVSPSWSSAASCAITTSACRI